MYKIGPTVTINCDQYKEDYDYVGVFIGASNNISSSRMHGIFCIKVTTLRIENFGRLNSDIEPKWT